MSGGVDVTLAARSSRGRQATHERRVPLCGGEAHGVTDCKAREAKGASRGPRESHLRRCDAADRHTMR